MDLRQLLPEPRRRVSRRLVPVHDTERTGTGKLRATAVRERRLHPAGHRRDVHRHRIRRRRAECEPNERRGGRHGDGDLERHRRPDARGLDRPLRAGKRKQCVSRMDLRQLLPESRRRLGRRFVPVHDTERTGAGELRATAVPERHLHPAGYQQSIRRDSMISR